VVRRGKKPLSEEKEGGKKKGDPSYGRKGRRDKLLEIGNLYIKGERERLLAANKEGKKDRSLKRKRPS